MCKRPSFSKPDFCCIVCNLLVMTLTDRDTKSWQKIKGRKKVPDCVPQKKKNK